jgi:hypothetical protein
VPSSTSSSERALVERLPLPPRVRGWAPLWAGLATFALAMAVWLAWIEPSLPAPLRRRPHPPGPLRWFVDGRAPFYLKGEPRAEGWLGLGDSRANHGFDEEHLPRYGVEPLSVLWVGGAQLVDLLSAARELPCRRIVVALSPLEIYRVITDTEQERKLAMGFVERSFSQRVDRAIAEQFLRLRSSLVHWQDTRGLAASWIERPLPGATDHLLQLALAPPTRADRLRALERIEQLMRDLQAEGRSLACVRMPISESLRAVEDEALDPALFVGLCERLGIPYVDYGTSEPTIDGSHLTAEAGRRLAPRLAEFMRAMP